MKRDGSNSKVLDMNGRITLAALARKLTAVESTAFKGALLASAIGVAAPAWAASADPLPSWNSGAAKDSIIEFVDNVTDPESGQYLPPAKRIATFDNDGTLWSEKPLYFQFYFALDRLKAMAPEHPEWQTTEPFASYLAGDVDKMVAHGEEGVLKVVAATHAGQTTEEFRQAAEQWLKTARHGSTGKLFTEMAFQPMLELLDYLRESDFKTFIVSGGGVDFIRSFAEEVYGIPPYQVVGSSIKATYEVRDGKPVMVKQPEIAFVDDKEGKPVGIHQYIGARPVLAFGNSDGDYQMLDWVTSGEGPSLGLLLHHTDALREWSYDRKSLVGTLDHGLDDADEKGWVLVDMKQDWNSVYPEKPADPTQAQLFDHSWRIEYIEGRGVVDNSPAAIDFAPDARVSGNSSCNSFSGQFSIAGGDLSFGQLVSTRRACIDSLMEQENRFLNALGLVQQWHISPEGWLFLMDETGYVIMRASALSKEASE
ncbi:heat shock protein HslJ [Marinobacterium mangrovicola]|uniref:Heat shock protein HslJ n=2 Tax=Marinobacterium mangrovicola TaxID=1476959 RepID=A0A4R1G4R8_9GAMM|nr:heat shock protein HslJ [Marinobacterium mangrovicola]